MASFFERRGYSAQTLKHDLEKMKHLPQSDALTRSNSTEEKMSRIPLILTHHPLNTRVQRILLDNFKMIADDPATSLIFPQPTMVVFCRDDNLRTSLVYTTVKHAATRAGTYPCQHPRYGNCDHIPRQRNRSSRAKRSLNHQRFLHLFVLWSDLLHLLPLLPCHLHRRDWARTLMNVLVNISEASTRMRLVFPSHSISVLTDILQPTHWSAGSNSAIGTGRGRGRKCVSSFDSGHASRAALMLIFTSFEVHARVQNATFKF